MRRQREGGGGGRALRSSQSIHFSARRLFFQEWSEQPALQSGFKLRRTRWEAKIRKKKNQKQKSKLRFRLTHFNKNKKKRKKLDGCTFHRGANSTHLCSAPRLRVCFIHVRFLFLNEHEDGARYGEMNHSLSSNDFT